MEPLSWPLSVSEPLREAAGGDAGKKPMDELVAVKFAVSLVSSATALMHILNIARKGPGPSRYVLWPLRRGLKYGNSQTYMPHRDLTEEEYDSLVKLISDERTRHGCPVSISSEQMLNCKTIVIKSVGHYPLLFRSAERTRQSMSRRQSVERCCVFFGAKLA